MRLPAGTLQEGGLELKKTGFFQKIKELCNERFSGYVVLLVEGFDGLEEGTIVLKNGEITASFYEYLKHGIIVFGDYALPQVLNASAAEHGVIDVIVLTAAQVDLIVAFQDKAQIRKLVKPDELKKYVGSEFNPAYAKKVLAKVFKAEKNEKSVLRRFGLGELEKGE